MWFRKRGIKMKQDEFMKLIKEETFKCVQRETRLANGC